MTASLPSTAYFAMYFCTHTQKYYQCNYVNYETERNCKDGMKNTSRKLLEILVLEIEYSYFGGSIILLDGTYL